MEETRIKKEFNFDEWAKDLDNHPAFMTKLPEGSELPAAIEALQAMKYDDDDTPEERAKSFKDEGNKHFQRKMYRTAVEVYTEGIKVACCDKELNAVLYANRAAANLRLGNCRTALKDCIYALKFNSDHLKAINRAECLFELREYEEVPRWVDKYSLCNDQKMLSLKMEALKLQDRGIKFWFQHEAEEVNNLEFQCLDVPLPNSSDVSVTRVREDNGALLWPVLFLYPEYGETDFIKEFHEDTCFQDCLHEMFSETAPWDRNNEYTDVKLLLLFYESYEQPDCLISVEKSSTLKTVLSSTSFRLKHGLPTFVILSQRSEFCSQYLQQHL